MGITFMTAIVAVGRYFNNKRAVATGIAMSGAGFGMFAYPYFTDLALHAFHWRGTVLLMAGIYLNCAVSGTIFRPISFLENSSVPEVKTLEKTDVEMASPVSFRRKLGNDTIYSSLPHINIQRLKEKNSVQKSSSLNCVKTDPFEIPVKNGLHHNNIYHSGFMQISCERIGSLQERPLSEDGENGCLSNADNFKILKQPTFMLILLVMVFWSGMN
jgi:hypothetical protein